MGVGYASQFTRHTATVGDLRVSYFIGGHGQPLLYLHGLSGWGRWESHHMTLGITNLVYAPQLPGWPEGPIPPSLTSVRNYAQVIAQFLDTVGIHTVDLVGHSFGGWIALHLAAAYPERVSRLVLVDAMGADVPEAPMANLERLDEEAFARAAFARTGEVVIRGDFGGVREDVRTGQEFERQWKSRAIVASLVRGHYADPELMHRLKTIAATTLIVWGQQDQLVPWRHGEVLAQAIPRAKWVVITEAGHTPMREKRETFQRIMHDFLIGQLEGIEKDFMVKR
jgi:pimeloyl-ACP methyl ester carboxylesterase